MIDWDRVDELRSEVGPEEFPEVVELFLEEVEELIARLRTDPDPAKFEEDLHFLKGSAWNLGFAAFGTMCQIGEKLAATGRAEGVNLDHILAIYDESKKMFLARLEADSPRAA